MTHHDAQPLIPLYAMDELDAAERAELEAHIADCPHCQRELADTRETLALLREGLAAEPVDATPLPVLSPERQAAVLAAGDEDAPIFAFDPDAAAGPDPATDAPGVSLNKKLQLAAMLLIGAGITAAIYIGSQQMKDSAVFGAYDMADAEPMILRERQDMAKSFYAPPEDASDADYEVLGVEIDETELYEESDGEITVTQSSNDSAVRWMTTDIRDRQFHDGQTGGQGQGQGQGGGGQQQQGQAPRVHPPRPAPSPPAVQHFRIEPIDPQDQIAATKPTSESTTVSSGSGIATDGVAVTRNQIISGNAVDTGDGIVVTVPEDANTFEYQVSGSGTIINGVDQGDDALDVDVLNNGTVTTIAGVETKIDNVAVTDIGGDGIVVDIDGLITDLPPGAVEQTWSNVTVIDGKDADPNTPVTGRVAYMVIDETGEIDPSVALEGSSDELGIGFSLTEDYTQKVPDQTNMTPHTGRVHVGDGTYEAPKSLEDAIASNTEFDPWLATEGRLGANGTDVDRLGVDTDQRDKVVLNMNSPVEFHKPDDEIGEYSSGAVILEDYDSQLAEVGDKVDQLQKNHRRHVWTLEQVVDTNDLTREPTDGIAITPDTNDFTAQIADTPDTPLQLEGVYSARSGDSSSVGGESSGGASAGYADEQQAAQSRDVSGPAARPSQIRGLPDFRDDDDDREFSRSVNNRVRLTAVRPAPPADTPPAPITAPRDADRTIKLPHFVESGDSLESVAQMYGARVEDIRRANPELANGKAISDLEHIEVPVPDMDDDDDRPSTREVAQTGERFKQQSLNGLAQSRPDLNLPELADVPDSPPGIHNGVARNGSGLTPITIGGEGGEGERQDLQDTQRIAEYEMILRQKKEAEANELIKEGQLALTAEDYAQAAEQLQNADKLLREVRIQNPRVAKKRELVNTRLAQSYERWGDQIMDELDVNTDLADYDQAKMNYVEAWQRDPSRADELRGKLQDLERKAVAAIEHQAEPALADTGVEFPQAYTPAELRQAYDSVAKDGPADETLKALETLITLTPDATDIADLQLRRAALLIQLQRPDEARATLETIAREWPTSEAATKAKAALAAPVAPPATQPLPAKPVEVKPVDEPAADAAGGEQSALPPRPRTPPPPVNPWELTVEDAESTFALEAESASWGLSKRFVRQGYRPPAAFVRMEEFVNAFDYHYPRHEGDSFAIYPEASPSPFRPELTLLRVGVKGKVIGRDQRQPAHFVFVIDASGSMDQADRLPLVQHALSLLLYQLGPADRVSIVTCETRAHLLTEAEPATNRDALLATIGAIETGASTNLQAGIEMGMSLAAKHFKAGHNNRVILCSDGVANVGAEDAEAILTRVDDLRRQGVGFTSVGVGAGNYDDRMLEQLANRGDGAYLYLDSRQTARALFVDAFAANLQPIAKDAKIQVVFNPERVRRYRLIGYENRAIADQDFRNDSIDAGEIGSGQAATAYYELELLPPKDEAAAAAPLGTVYVRCTELDGQVTEIDRPLAATILAPESVAANPRFYLGAAMAEFAEILRGSPHVNATGLPAVERVLAEVANALPLDPEIREAHIVSQQVQSLPQAP